MSTGIQLGQSVGVRIPHADATVIAPLTLGRPGPQGPEGEPGPPGSTFAYPDEAKTAQFRPADEDTKVGWGGSDVCENIQLKDGRDMFFWGDTLIGDLTPSNEWTAGYAFHKRSITITEPGQQMDDGVLFDQDSALLTPLKTPPGTPATPDEWFWFGGLAGNDGGDVAYAFTTGIGGTGGPEGGFAFKETRRCALAVFNISDPNNITLTRWDLFHATDPDTGIVWGETAHLHTDGYIYLIGRKGNPDLTSNGYAMRVLASDVWGTKQFWDGTAWTAGATPASIGTFPSVPNGLRYEDGTWFGLVVPFYGDALEIWTAPEITGPWGSLGEVWYFPDTANCFYYSPRFVPQWDDQTSVAVIVARNSKEDPLEAWEYQPQVIRISPMLFHAASGTRVLEAAASASASRLAAEAAEGAATASQSAAEAAVGAATSAQADAAVSAASATSAAQSATDAAHLVEAPADEAVAAIQSGPSTTTVTRSGVLNPTAVTHAGVQAALDSAKTHGLRVQTAGAYSTDQTLVIEADCDLSGLTITYTGAGIGIKVGPDTGSLQNRTVVLPHVKHGSKTTTGWGQVAGTIGVRLRNIYACTVTGRETGAFETGWQLLGDSSGFVYNTIRVGRLANNKINLNPHTINAGWTNENVFIGGQCFHYSGEAAGGSGSGMTGPAPGTRHVLFTSGSSEWAGPNANKFFGMALENVGATEFAVDFDNAGRNHFDGCRWETWLGGASGYPPRVRYGTVATENVITGGYDAHRIEITTASASIRGNNIISPLGSRYRFANQPVTGPGDVGGWLLENTSGNTSPVTQVMPAGWETAGVSRSTGWLWKWTGHVLEGKRTEDAHPRVRLDARLGQFKLGSGTVEPASGLVGTASDLRAMSTFSPLTNAAFDLGVGANRWRNAYVSGEVHVGSLILRDNSGVLQCWSGGAWKTVNLT